MLFIFIVVFRLYVPGFELLGNGAIIVHFLRWFDLRMTNEKFLLNIAELVSDVNNALLLIIPEALPVFFTL